MDLTIGHIEQALRADGLEPMGAFHPDAGDGVPAGADGRTTGTLVLAGNAGPAMWRAFTATEAKGADPLDAWSRDRISGLAADLGATPVYISQAPPYPPFQRWARRAGCNHTSPLGILIHPDFGLWHAFRGALAFARRLELPPPDDRPSPCDSCQDKPCLATCPVNAFTTGHYDVAACTGHLDTPEGQDCLGRGCVARRACPIGRDYIYHPEQARHHMEAFWRANRGG